MSTDIDFNEFFNDSYEYVLGNDELFFNEFYRVFISSSPEIKEVFKNTDMTKQKDMLRDSVSYMVSFFVTKIADVRLIQTGKHHTQALKVSPQMYELFVDTFLIALENTYSRYNSKCGLAWRITLSPGIELMKHSPEIEV